MASSFCSACGSAITPDRRFCSQCGEPVAAVNLPAQPPAGYGAPPPQPPAGYGAPPPQPAAGYGAPPPQQPVAYGAPPPQAGGYYQQGGYAPQPYGQPAWGGPAVATPGLVQFDVAYPQHLTNWLPLVKGILAIPLAIVLMLYVIGVYVVTGIAWWVILFTGKYPEGMWNFVVNTLRFAANVNAYSMLLRDEYPPFTGTQGAYQPVQFSLDYPPKLSRGLIFIKGLLAIPHLIVLELLGIGVYVALIVAFFSILFTGKFPPGMFNFVVGVQRWGLRAVSYMLLLTDRYPPFTMDAVPQQG